MLTDNMWRVEDWQLITRIQANQFRYLVRQFLWVWFMSAIILIVYSCGNGQRKEYAGTWVIASVMRGEQVVHKGEGYNRVKMRRWLDREVYQGTFWDWAKWVPKVSFLPAGIGSIFWLLWFWHRPPENTHVRGAEIVEPGRLRGQLRKIESSGIEIGGVPIPKDLDHTHYLITGASGAGKSTLIMGMLEQATRLGETAIVFDIEGEYASRFYDPDRGDKIINPMDERGVIWNPWAECETPGDMEAEAASLLPITPQIEHSPAGFYRATGRTVYAALLERLDTHDPRRIPELLADPKRLVELLEGTPAAAVLGKGATRERQSILIGLVNATAAFRYLQPGPHTWSAREWVKDRRGWLFFTVKESQKRLILPFLALTLDALSRRLLDAEMRAAQTTRLVIDELAGLPPLETLPDLLRRMRKRGLSITIGFQEIAGLIALYGQALTASMLNAPSIRCLMRGNDADTNAWCARDIGEEETQRRNQSRTAGPDNLRDSVHRTVQQHTNDAVLASQFRLLNPGQAYLTVGQYGTSLVTLPMRSVLVRQEAFIPRDLTTKAAVSVPRSRRRI